MKKLLCSPVAGLGYIVASSWLFIRFAGPPSTPLSLLGVLSLVGAIALAVFFLVTSVTYRSNGTSGGIGVLAILIACVGGTIIAFTLAASALGVSAALTYVGIAVVAALAATAMAALSGGEN